MLLRLLLSLIAKTPSAVIQRRKVDLITLIAAATVAAAALFVLWRAPSEVLTPRDEEPALDPRVIQSLERG